MQNKMYTLILPSKNTPLHTPDTASTDLDTPSLNLLSLSHQFISTTPTPLKTHFFRMPAPLPSPGLTPPPYEPANPYRDLTLQDVPLTPAPVRIGRFAPPRFSSRLRSLVQQRPRGPLRVYLVPPTVNEKQQLRRHAWGIPTVLTAGSAAWVETAGIERSTAEQRARMLFAAITIAVVFLVGLGWGLGQVWGL
ncbi:hypothetical protein FN846DRAFT_713820 [Sphaerosporella brunnea]|uniref:Uncharacterized protein n=1 Tax=Sphaerosporella brunnea TaxID=1250544 RepID=A0A5J5EX84_9PEZI|nr:hypothetical protein FN846DRAFT_713082 [Sphaerosporella brunnea]KAA8906672.1 hypothetical protein FN846DRAFT_713820 [Sphaerosporella brunnea]